MRADELPLNQDKLLDLDTRQQDKKQAEIQQKIANVLKQANDQKLSERQIKMLMQRLEADVFRIGDQYTARAATEVTYKSVNDLKPKNYIRDCNFSK